jgi:hypothetical protein
MIAAYEELGCSREEAVDQAIQRFGKPEKLGRAVGFEVNRTRLECGLRAMPLPLKVATAFVFFQALSQAGHHLSIWLETGAFMTTLPVPGWLFVVGLGLLLRRPFWWKMAVASSCFSLAMGMLGVLLTLDPSFALHPMQPLHHWVFVCLLYMGHLWLLTRGEVRDFFARPSSHPRTA